jgi:hypothetical protein
MSKQNETKPTSMITWDELASQFKELTTPEAATVVDTLAGTWAKEKGAVIVGVISHLYTWGAPNDDGEVGVMHGLAVTLNAPTKVNTDAGRIIVKEGKVGITLSRKLKPLLYLRPGDTIAVLCLGETQFKTGEGKIRRAWNFKVQSNAQLRPEPMVTVDLPF